MSITVDRDRMGDISPGSLVRIRDETWLVTSVEDTSDGPLYSVPGVSEFVTDATATFYGILDRVSMIAPEDSEIVANSSPRYCRSRLWTEPTLRKGPVPRRPRPAASISGWQVRSPSARGHSLTTGATPWRMRCRTPTVSCWSSWRPWVSRPLSSARKSDRASLSTSRGRTERGPIGPKSSNRGIGRSSRRTAG